MSYEPYDPLMAPLEDRIAWALCQIIDDDAPMRWTRYRFVAGCIASNPTLMTDLQTLRDRKLAAQRTSVRPEELRALVKGLATGKIIPPEAVPTIRTRDIHFGPGHTTPPGGYKREAIQDPLIPPQEDPPL